jgi:hypothetical protein
MPDITKIAADCATRIMDRMEMCRGSAILKGDIEREVEMALRQLVPTVSKEVDWGPDVGCEQLKPTTFEDWLAYAEAKKRGEVLPTPSGCPDLSDQTAYDRWMVDAYARAIAEHRARQPALNAKEADVPSSVIGQSTGPFETSSFTPTNDSLLVYTDEDGNAYCAEKGGVSPVEPDLEIGDRVRLPEEGPHGPRYGHVASFGAGGNKAFVVHEQQMDEPRTDTLSMWSTDRLVRDGCGSAKR